MDSFFDLSIFISTGLFGVKRGKAVLCKAQYDSIELHGDYAIVRSGNKKGILDSKGAFCLPLSRCSVHFLLEDVVFVDENEQSFVYNLATSKKLFCQKAERKDDVLLIDNQTIVDKTLSELLSFDDSEWCFVQAAQGLLYFYGKGTNDKTRAYYKSFLVAEWTGEDCGLKRCEEGFSYYDGQQYTNILSLSGKVINHVSANLFNVKYNDIPIYGLRLYYKDGLYGLEDYSGTVFLPPIYNSIRAERGLYIANKGSNCTILNKYLNPLAELNYEGFRYEKEVGLIEVETDKQFGLVDLWGRVRIPCEYDHLRFLTDSIVEVNKGSRYGYLDVYGNILLPLDFESTAVTHYSEHADWEEEATFGNNDLGPLCRIKCYGAWGAMDRHARIVIPCEYDDFRDDFDNENVHVIGFRKDGFWHVFDSDGKEIIGGLERMSSFVEGRSFIKRAGKWGYIKEDGRLLEPGFVYLDAEWFENGRARVQKEDNLYYLIDREGRTVSRGYKDISQTTDRLYLVSIGDSSYYMDRDGHTSHPDDSFSANKPFGLSFSKMTNSSYKSFFWFVYCGQSIDDTVKKRGFTRGTIINHIIPYIVAGISRGLYSDEALVSPEKKSKVQTYIKIDPHCKSLKTIYDFLLGDVTYDEIRLSLALILRDYDAFSKEELIRQYDSLNKEVYFGIDSSDENDNYNDNDDFIYNDESMSYEESLAEACDGFYDAMLELEDRG